MDKKSKRRAATAAVAVAAASSMLVGGVVDDPGELLDEPDAIVLDLSSSDEAAPSGDGEEEEERRTLRARCRGWILSLPWGVRVLVGVPLWCVGTVLLTLVQLLWGSLLSPLALRIAVWALAAVLLLAVFAFGIKAAFPHLPLKKILNRRSIVPLLGGVCLVAVSDALLETFWDAYAQRRDAVCAAALALVLFLGVVFFGIRTARRRKAEASESAAESMEDARRRVLALADSVKRI